MKIVVASGKGGTGKTLVATNLAKVIAQSGLKVAYLDCDVEEPNGHIFLHPQLTVSRPVSVLVPEVDADKCSGCGKCSQICRFNAIAVLKEKAVTFPELCHSCGGCSLVCPDGAIEEVEQAIGTLEQGSSNGIAFASGRLKIGATRSNLLIREVKKGAPDDGIVLIDSPPGAACPAAESVREADIVLLVAESTPFGLHDLRVALEMIRHLNLPAAVVINRTGLGDDIVEEFCAQNQIPILLSIREDRSIAEAYSKGKLVVNALPRYLGAFQKLAERILEEKIT